MIEVVEIPLYDTSTILLGYRGSIAHNMYVPKNDPNHIDDVDIMGVVVGPIEAYLGLQEWGSRGTKEYKHEQWDCVFYEIRKMFSLLLQGNPNVLSLLWIKPEHYLHSSLLGQQIVEHRKLFVGKHIYNAFAGYAHAQMEKMEARDPAELRRYIAVDAELKRRGCHPNCKGEIFEIEQADSGEERDVREHSNEALLQVWRAYQRKGQNIGYLGLKRKELVLQNGYDTKNAAHLIRLLRMCVEFMDSGELIVYRTVDAAELLDIKCGKWALDHVKDYAEYLFLEAKKARDRSSLPEKPDRDEAEKLLVEIVRGHLAL